MIVRQKGLIIGKLSADNFGARIMPSPGRRRRWGRGSTGFTRGSFENADVDVRGTAGLETRATFMPGCEPKDHG